MQPTVNHDLEPQHHRRALALLGTVLFGCGASATTPDDVIDAGAPLAATMGPIGGVDRAPLSPAGAALDAGSERADAAPQALTQPDAGPARARWRVYVSGYDSKISRYGLDGATAALSPEGTVSQPEWPPSYMGLATSGRLAFALAQSRPGKLVSYRVDATGGLDRIGAVSTAPANGPVHLAIDASDRWVFLAHYDSGLVSVHPIGEDGKAGPPSDTQPVGALAHGVLVAPSGKFVLVASNGANRIAQFRFDPTTGKLAANTPATVGLSGGPRHLAFHPTERFVYVISEGGNTMTSFRYDAAAGTLSAPATLSTLPAGFTGSSGAAHVVVAPSGRFVYGSNRGHDSLVIYAVDQDSGRLSLVGHELAAGAIKNPRDFALSGDGLWLVLANQDSASLVVFRVDETTGRLTRESATSTPPKPTFVGLLPG